MRANDKLYTGFVYLILRNEDYDCSVSIPMRWTVTYGS